MQIFKVLYFIVEITFNISESNNIVSIIALKLQYTFYFKWDENTFPLLIAQTIGRSQIINYMGIDNTEGKHYRANIIVAVQSTIQK